MINAEEWNSIAATAPLDMAAMDSLVASMVHAWEDYEPLRVAASEAKAKAEFIEKKIMEALTSAGKTKYFVDGIGTVSKCPRFSVQTPKTPLEKAEFFKFLLAKGGKELYYTLVSVNSNTLNGWYKEEAERATSAGQSNFSVPGLNPPTTQETLRFTKDKKHGKEAKF